MFINGSKVRHVASFNPFIFLWTSCTVLLKLCLKWFAHAASLRSIDTLIVWTEPDGVDYALSFQDPDGCSEVWNFILDVQRHMNANGELFLPPSRGLPLKQVPGDDHTATGSSSPLIGPNESITTTSIIRAGHLPTPRMGIMGEIERAIKALARTQVVKEKICEYIQQEVLIFAIFSLSPHS